MTVSVFIDGNIVEKRFYKLERKTVLLISYSNSATIAPILSYHFTGLIHIDKCVQNCVHIVDFPYV